MQTIPTPTTRTYTRESGETVKVTEWTIGAYTLRKSEEPGYTGWGAINIDRTRPRVEDIAAFSQPTEFGVSFSSESDLSPEGAVAYAAQVMEAAETATAFNEIIAAN